MHPSIFLLIDLERARRVILPIFQFVSINKIICGYTVVGILMANIRIRPVFKKMAFVHKFSCTMFSTEPNSGLRRKGNLNNLVRTAG